MSYGPDLPAGATIVLHHSDAPTTQFSGPGIPNYLGAFALSPDGLHARFPSKQDNVKRGLKIIATDSQPGEQGEDR